MRNRTIALETKDGSLAVFPPPHRYFYPLDEAYNLGFTWRGNDFMEHVPGFGIGVRQDLQGDNRWVPWFNAPPGTKQELGIFWLASIDRGKRLFDRVKATWIRRGGAVVVNVVAFWTGEHVALARAVVRTLRASFAHVRAFVDHDPSEQTDEPANIVSFASDKPFGFDAPPYAEDDQSVDWMWANFQSWEVLQAEEQAAAMIVQQELRNEVPRPCRCAPVSPGAFLVLAMRVARRTKN